MTRRCTELSRNKHAGMGVQITESRRVGATGGSAGAPERHVALCRRCHGGVRRRVPRGRPVQGGRWPDVQPPRFGGWLAGLKEGENGPEFE